MHDPQQSQQQSQQQPHADLPPAAERSGDKAPSGQDAPGHFGVSAEQLAEFAFFVAGAATGPLMRDNPSYVFPAHDVGLAVCEAVRERFGFDPAAMPGYRGLALAIEDEHEGLAQARQTRPEA